MSLEPLVNLVLLGVLCVVDSSLFKPKAIVIIVNSEGHQVSPIGGSHGIPSLIDLVILSSQEMVHCFLYTLHLILLL